MRAYNKLKQRKTTRCARVFRCLKRYVKHENSIVFDACRPSLCFITRRNSKG